jgi:hypothetical protein
MARIEVLIKMVEALNKKLEDQAKIIERMQGLLDELDNRL